MMNSLRRRLDVGFDPESVLHLQRIPNLRFVEQRHHHAAGPRSSGAPGTVHVVFVLGRRIVMDDGFDPVDVDASGGDVGGDQRLHFAACVLSKRIVTL